MKYKRNIRSLALCLTGFFYGIFLWPQRALAETADGNSAITGINTLVDLAGNIISAIGAFVVIWGIFELGTGMQQHDGAQMASAGKRIAGGLVMVAAPQLLKLFV